MLWLHRIVIRGRLRSDVAHGNKHSVRMPHWLLQLGIPGVFAVAALDSSMIRVSLPGSTDLLVLLLASHDGRPWLLALAATAGSVLGGYLTWAAGKKSGESLLRRHVPARFLSHAREWVTHRGALTVITASILPPPFPLFPVLLAAGVLGMARRKFLISFAIGRSARYSVIAWLGVRFGSQVLRSWSQHFTWLPEAILGAWVALVAASIVAGIWKYKRAE